MKSSCIFSETGIKLLLITLIVNNVKSMFSSPESRAQCELIGLGMLWCRRCRRRCCPQCSNISFKTPWPIKAELHVDHP